MTPPIHTNTATEIQDSKCPLKSPDTRKQTLALFCPRVKGTKTKLLLNLVFRVLEVKLLTSVRGGGLTLAAGLMNAQR